MLKPLVFSLLAASLLLPARPAFGQEPPASPLHETRAVWLATVWGLDWPSAGASSEAQQQRLRAHFETLKARGFNTIIFQTVAHGEALFPSERLPWMRWLTGTQGRDPGWDPLAFAVEEAHRLGMELHAWYNVSHVGSDTQANRPSTASHVTLAHPDWIRRKEDALWLDPALPDARAWVVGNVAEIVEKYDVDAVHFDYMRYPSGGFAQDVTTWREHPNGAANISDWRRENLNILAREIYDAVNVRKPWVKVGAAPIGAYKNYSGAPPGFWAFDDAYQASRFWVREGVHDYLAPQLYFTIGDAPNPDKTYKSQDFARWLRDWLTYRFDRHIYIGHGTYMETERTFSAGEIIRQIDLVREEGAQGQVHFRLLHVTPSILGGRYEAPALPVPMPWKMNGAAPAIPAGTTIELDRAASAITVRWSPPEAAAEDPLRRYAVFRREGAAPTGEASELVGFLGAQDTTFTEVFAAPPGVPVYYRVAAQSLLGFLSDLGEPVGTDMTTIPVEGPEQPGALHIAALYPNPASSTARVAYEVTAPARVMLKVYDTLGREVAEVVQGVQAAGRYEVAVPAETLAPGVYLVVLDDGTHRDTRRLVIAR